MEAGPFRMEQHGRNVFTRIDPEHPDYAEWVRGRDAMVAELPGRIAELREELRQQLAPFDAFDVIADLWLANVPKDRESYRESTEEGLLVIPELAAALLISRPTRVGDRAGEWFAPHGHDVQEKLKTLLLVEQFRIFSDAADSADAVYDEIRVRARAHHMAVRGVSYSWQEEATARQLCGEGEIGTELASLTGFSVDEAFRLAESVTDVGLGKVEARIANAHEFAETFIAAIEEARSGRTAAGVPAELAEFVAQLARLKRSVAAKRARYMAASWASYGSGSTLAFRVPELAEHADVPEETASAFLARFSTPFGFVPEPPREPGLSDLRERPILADGEGNYLCCSPHNLLWAIRPSFEAAARHAGGSTWRRYEAHRRRTVEQRAVGALAAALRADWSRSGVHYETTEDGQEKRPELDGVVRLDVAAFIIESKASAMRPAARRGAPDALRDWLTREVGRGGLQLRRAREALFGAPLEERVTLTDEHGVSLGLDLGGVEHVIELVIVLEDLPAIAPVTWRMAEAGFLPAEDPPIVISLHELEIICEISSRPCELVHYFLRRKRLNRQRRATAADELDFFMHYLRDGLYWDDPEDMETPPDTPEAPIQLLSFTDPLDAYYMYARGERRTPAAKPERRHHRDVATVLDLVDNLDQPGRLGVALALLDLAQKPRERVVGDMRRLKKLSAREGRRRDRSYFGRDFGITVMAVPPTEAAELPQMLQTYCRLKQYQLRTSTWAGFGVFEGPPELFQTAVVWAAPWEPDPELDRLVATLPSYGHERESFDGRKHVAERA
jgi:hypothetical protein